MENITEINKKLDSLYEEYIKKGNSLSDGKMNDVVLLLARKTGDPNSNTMKIAEQLSRFSAKICQMYFDTLTKTTKPSILVIDDLLRDFLALANSSKQPQHYVKRFADTIVPVIKNYKDAVFDSKMLSSLVAFIARFALKSPNSKEVFKNTVNKTNGAIYLLDYTNVNNKSMENIWKVTNDVFRDLTKAKYETFIIEWGEKYGFNIPTKTAEPASTNTNVKIEESVLAKEETSAAMQPPVKTESINTTLVKEESEAPVTNDAVNEKKEKPKNESVSSKDDMPAENPVASADEKASNNTSEAAVRENVPAKKGSVQVLYDRLKRDIDKEQEAIITAFTDMITPVGKAFESIQGEISKSREIGAENVSLKANVADLERQLSEQRERLQTVNQSLMAARTENEELKSRVTSLESQNSELDSKLNDAYAINSRESSLEAEKIRSELKKAFAFLYEDWLEYEFSDVSEENYESLQAIIKKIFRSLERSGIDFKGNN
ncbi:MAG TPA: hypothetical protein P5092_13420 [Ruminococcus sp.]|nr:hypothetical protein [Ruminococcus sp.]HRU98418.1 hypothetical protein [Ruminococcus sp.]